MRIEGEPDELVEFILRFKGHLAVDKEQATRRSRLGARTAEINSADSVNAPPSRDGSVSDLGQQHRSHSSKPKLSLEEEKAKKREYARNWYQRHKVKKGQIVAAVPKPEVGGKYEYCVGCDKAVHKKFMAEHNGDRLCPECLKKME